MKRITAILIALLLLLPLTAFASHGEEGFIIVSDGYISEETLSHLNSKAKNIYTTYGFSAYFIMNDEVKENGAYASAARFYEDHVKGKGVVFCMDAESGKCYVYGGEDFSEEERNAFLFAYTSSGGMTYGERVDDYLTKAAQTAKALQSDEKKAESERLMPRFMDNAGVIDDKKESAIYTDIDSFSEKNLTDVVFVTYSSDEEPDAYADKYYEEYNFGFGEKKTGVILAVNTKNDAVSVKAKGDADSFFEKGAIKAFNESLSPFSGEYINLFIDYLEWLDENMTIKSGSDNAEETSSQASDVSAVFENIGEKGELMPRIFDGAKIISDDREAEIRAVLDKISADTGIDFVVTTVYKVPDGLSAGEYAEKYFEYFDFGHAEEKNGVLLMIGFEPECCFLTAFGKAETYFSSDDLKDYTEAFYSQFKRQDYDEAVHTFAYEAAQRLMKEKLKAPVIAAVLLVFAAVLVTLAIVFSKKKQKEAQGQKELLTQSE